MVSISNTSAFFSWLNGHPQNGGPGNEENEGFASKIEDFFSSWWLNHPVENY